MSVKYNNINTSVFYCEYLTSDLFHNELHGSCAVHCGYAIIFFNTDITDFTDALHECFVFSNALRLNDQLHESFLFSILIQSIREIRVISDKKTMPKDICVISAICGKRLSPSVKHGLSCLTL